MDVFLICPTVDTRSYANALDLNEKLKGRVCYQGRRQYAQLDKELNFGFRETGSLVITLDEADLPRLEAIKENGEKNGLPDIEILEHDEILALDHRSRLQWVKEIADINQRMSS